MAHEKVYAICEDKCWEETMTKKQIEAIGVRNAAATIDSTAPINAGNWVETTITNFDVNVPPIIETGNVNIVSSIVSVENNELKVVFHNLSNEDQSAANIKIYYRVINA